VFQGVPKCPKLYQGVSWFSEGVFKCPKVFQGGRRCQKMF
jgi:hypothetical protein